MTLSPPPASAPASAADSESRRDGDAVGVRSQRWAPVVLPPLVGILMLSLTGLYWQSEERAAAARRDQNFQRAADHIARNLEDRMAAYEVVLRGVKGYFEGSERIDRGEFEAYIGALRLEETRPGLQGVSLLLRLRAHELQAHVADMRSRGFPDYTVRPPGARAVYAPITHIEPLAGDNLKALGFDAMTAPAAQEAMDRARDTGELALSAPLTLQQDADAVDSAGSAAQAAPLAPRAPGLVMYVPIYATGTPVTTAAQRQGALVGWVSAPFRLRSVIESLAREFDADIALRVFDGASPRPDALLYGAPDGAAGAEPAAPTPHGSRQLSIGGRTWLLQMLPSPSFELRHRYSGHYPLALAGAAVSLLLAWVTWLLATARERAVGIARTMTSQLRAARDDLESTLNAIPDLLFELDLEGRILHYRSARSEELAVPEDMFLGRLLQEVVPPGAAAGCRASLQAAHHTGYAAGHQFQLSLQGAPHWFELSIARKPAAAEHEGPRFVALARDITERKRAEARTHELAYFDGLTGLPNRRLLLDRLEHALVSAVRESHVGALLYVDLDNFKQINDAQGHSVGDALLLQAARRLSELLQPGDTVARLGGDEFVVLVRNVAPDMDTAGRAAMAIAETVRSALEVPYAIDTHLYSSTGSIGITLFPKRGEGVEDLVREADTAMYRAKDLGRNRIRFFEAAMQADVQERLALEQDLKNAQAAGQISVFAQNQVNAGGEVVGAELLMRWHHPVRGQVPPSKFIPVAEASGLILRMGDWMILQACETLARLQAAGHELSLSVNVSQRQFRQDDFVDRVRQVLAQTGAQPSSLILEVTESLLIENLEDTIARMTEIVALGVRFSIDDFGTGYSSFAYLKRLPLFELKIDKSFVQDTPDDPNDTAIVQSIISVARHLHLRVVAEGVETRAQADFLTESQCECLQGYLFGRPQPLEAWLKDWLRRD